MKKIIIGFMMVLLLAQIGSASIIDDSDNYISGIVKNLRSLSIPIISSVQVTCVDNSNNCKYSGGNWHILTTIMASNQNLVFTLPAGTQWSDSFGTTTAGTTVKFTLTPVSAFQKQTVTPINKYYTMCKPYGICAWLDRKLIPGYQIAGYSYKEVSLNAKIESAYGSNTLPFTYNYTNKPVYTMSDGKYTMQFSPSYIVDWGIDMGASSLVFVDNGYGEYIAFSSSTFYTAVATSEADFAGIIPQTGPTNWIEYLAYLKSKHGLVQYQLPAGTTLKITDSNTMVFLEYPNGAVGINGDILIPKAMATSVTVQIDDGKAEIGSISVSPSPFTLGSGYITVTVPVKNVGTSSDNFEMTIQQSFGIVSYVKNGGSINKGDIDTYTAKITPTVTTSQCSSFTVIVEAMGSHNLATQDKTICLVASNPTNPKQWVSITTLDADGKGLGSAPIFQNGVQIGSGFKEVELVYGTYEFSTNNVSNPTLFAPNPVSVTLSGGAEKVVTLKFTTTPPVDDSTTLLIMVLVAVILIFIAWNTGFLKAVVANPALIIPIILLIIVMWIVLQTLLVIAGITQSMSSMYNSIVHLGGLIK